LGYGRRRQLSKDRKHRWKNFSWLIRIYHRPGGTLWRHSLIEYSLHEFRKYWGELEKCWWQSGTLQCQPKRSHTVLVIFNTAHPMIFGKLLPKFQASVCILWWLTVAEDTQWTSGILFVLMEYFWTKPE
jgi:hypothetical protein